MLRSMDLMRFKLVVARRSVFDWSDANALHPLPAVAEFVMFGVMVMCETGSG